MNTFQKSTAFQNNDWGKPKPPGFSKLFFILIAVGIIVYLASSEGDFWAPFRNHPDLDPAEVVAAEREAEEIRDRHETWVQYVLIADSQRKRPCLRCPNGIRSVTLNAGEIYKYGITTQGKARYSKSAYQQLGVVYFEQFTGSYIACKEMEVNKIIAYRFLPESKKPEVKLLRPPGNANKN